MVLTDSLRSMTGIILSQRERCHLFKPLLRFLVFMMIVTAMIAFPWADAKAAIAPPGIEWQKSLGGSGAWDGARSVQQTSDGGYIVAGLSDSNNGDITGNHGGDDYWIVKLDASGTKLWEKSLGGSGSDFAESTQQTSDGGYVVAGQSNSVDGDITGSRGGWDYWVVKLDA
ncbi:MAG: hypothetical protein LBL73_03095, partial [Synergistaceae bacterium]|nr:hypothetical protein [Synergistaceae bacterium]